MVIAFSHVAQAKIFQLIKRKDCIGIINLDREYVRLSFDDNRDATVSWTGRVTWIN